MTAERRGQETERPLVFDLDGTLIRTDSLIESVVLLAKNNLLLLLMLPVWLLKGKAHLKSQIAARVNLDATLLPYDGAAMTLLRQAESEGRSLVLATAAHRSIADGVANHLGCFSKVLASDERTNLSSHTKQAALVKIYGEKGFDYVGNSRDDVAVWEHSHTGYHCNAPEQVLKNTRRRGITTRGLTPIESTPTWRLWLRQLRVKQWVKNSLLFVPLLASHQLVAMEQLVLGIIGFLALSFSASAIYIINDIVDLSEDRQHKRKRGRPLAAGDLPVLSAVAVAAGLLLGAAVLCAIVGKAYFSACVAVYLATTTLYSFALKKRLLLDVITLASLFTLRVIAGIALYDLSLTFWLLAFSMFIFLSLALVKRCTELIDSRARQQSGQAPGRAYNPADIEMISALGAASGYLSVLVLALYIQEQSTIALYSRPELIWLACPILMYWISRIWLLTHRGELHDDPVIFAITDKASLVCGSLFLLVFWFAT